MEDFVHLHLHTEYSLLDGAARIGKVVQVAKDMGMKSIAITDHGNMYGTIALFDECKKVGDIKPIFGCEFYVADDLHQKSGKPKLRHLILLVKNEEGYKNICMLNTIAFRDGYYYKPRIDYKTLKEYSNGLVCLSACLAGTLPQLLLSGQMDEADKFVESMKEMFGEDFYVEVQDHGLEDEKRVYPMLVDIARRHGVKTVATNDVHYINKEDSVVQDVLMCVQMQKTVDDPDRLKFDTDEFYLKTGDQMAALFPDNPEAIKNTVEIADKCNFTFKDIDKNLYLFPQYHAPDGQDNYQFLRKMVFDGLEKKYPEVTQTIIDRAERELALIKRQGFVEYFLTVWDYINAARNMGVPVGPGRGSGAGSIVAYAIGITNIDPLKFDLLFERFLHEERVTAPDFDVDFADDRRGDVIEYVRQKYGEKRVVKIVTFGTMAAKNAIKDVGRVLRVPYSELDKVTKNIPNIPAKHHDVLQKCFGFYKSKEGEPNYAIPELVETYNTNPDIKKVVDIAMKLEGMPRQCSTHACGVVIGSDDLEKFMPLSRNGDDITTQYSMTDIERLGHLKMDFLGLRNLNDIQKAIEYVKENHGVDIDFMKLGYDDPEVYKLISSGNTKAIFQIESTGFQKFLKQLRPTCIEDITAGVSLYRPGPMDSIPTYTHNKHHPEDVKYDHPILENILNVTYGCIVYQEQVMRICQDMAGYTLGQADMVRRMMGKKKVDAMKAEKQVFLYGKPAQNGKPAIDGAVKRGVPEDVAIKVWDQMEKFAQYAFNKSHAAAYSLITYQTAYLKCYYEPEFLTAVLNNRITNIDEIKNYVTYARSEGIEILPPDINKSMTGFSVRDGKIRFGLAALKNVGLGVIDSIIDERNRGGEFKDFMDFAKRVDPQALNKRCLESLILSGAFDCFGKFRSQLMQVYDMVVDRVSKDKKNRETGQFSLFDDPTLVSAVEFDEIQYPRIKEFNKEAFLKFEKEVVGIYISGSPLDDYINEYKNFNFTSDMIANVDSGEEGETVDEDQQVDGDEKFQDSGLVDNMRVTCGGLVSVIKKVVTKMTNKEMGILTIEDLYGSFDCMLFANNYAKYKYLLKEDQFVKIEGKLSLREGQNPIIIAEKISFATSEQEKPIVEELPKEQKLYLKFDVNDKNTYSKVEEILSSYPGTSQIVIKDELTGSVFMLKNRNVKINDGLINELIGELGEKNVVVR